MEEYELKEEAVEDGTSAAIEPSSGERPAEPFPEALARPAVEEHRQGEPLYWYRWKGSLRDVMKIFRLAQELTEQATAGQPKDPFSESGTYTVRLRGREREFRNLEDLEAEASDFELDSIQGLSLYLWHDKVNVSINIDQIGGTSLNVRGKDPFAVAGLESELKTAMDRGRRWSQVGGWPVVVAFWAPWVAILGISLIALSSSDIADAIGKGALALGGCLFLIVLFMRYVEPKLVPPLELLDDSHSQTVAQVWKARGLKVLGFAAVGVAGAAINGLTGFLF